MRKTIWKKYISALYKHHFIDKRMQLFEKWCNCLRTLVWHVSMLGTSELKWSNHHLFLETECEILWTVFSTWADEMYVNKEKIVLSWDPKVSVSAHTPPFHLPVLRILHSQVLCFPNTLGYCLVQWKWERPSPQAVGTFST